VKRFWSDARAVEGDGGWGIELDGRPLKTPARVALVLPKPALAEAVVAEWSSVGEAIDPREMPLTGLANAAIDRVAPDPTTFASGLAKYAEADLFCYRAALPPSLVARQEAQWDPLLDWARRRFDVGFVVTAGVLHVDQPKATVVRLGQAVHALDAFRLAGLSPLVTITGSLVAALGVIEEAVPLHAIWAAVSLDEQWQAEQWGEDVEATQALAHRQADFEAAARFLGLLG